MKILKKVPAIEVKRAFVIADFVSHQKFAKKDMGAVSSADYARRVAKAKEVVLQLPEAMLDMILKGEWSRRWRAYNAVDWHLAEASVTELGVWKGAGGLPRAWTDATLDQTAAQVAEALVSKPRKLKRRSYTAIPGIIAVALPTVQKEKYLLPIAFVSGVGTKGRRGLKTKVKADLDDGCMRSVALAVAGKRKLKIYLGKPKER